MLDKADSVTSQLRIVLQKQKKLLNQIKAEVCTSAKAKLTLLLPTTSIYRNAV